MGTSGHTVIYMQMYLSVVFALLFNPANIGVSGSVKGLVSKTTIPVRLTQARYSKTQSIEFSVHLAKIMKMLILSYCFCFAPLLSTVSASWQSLFGC